MKFLLALLLAIVPLFSQAKAVAESQGPRGKLVLHDTKCPTTDAPDIFYFEAVAHTGEVVFYGCWQDLGHQGIIVARFDTMEVIQLDRKTFDWNKHI